MSGATTTTTTTTNAYPILAQLRLDGPRGLVRRNRERLKDIPTERTGVGLVLDVDGLLYEVENGTPLRSAYGIRKASAVILVDLRQRRIKVDVTLPSRQAHRDFTATAVFRCQVRSASAMVEAQVDDFREALAGWTATGLRNYSRSIAPEQTPKLERDGRRRLVNAIDRTPFLPSTVMVVNLISFEVHVSEQQRAELAAADARARNADVREWDAKDRIHQLDLDDEINGHTHRVEGNREEQERERRDREAAVYRKALAAGPEALMALLLADDRTRIPEVLNLLAQNKAALYEILVGVTHSPHIDGSVMEPYARHLVDAVGQQLGIGPRLAEPRPLAEGKRWEGDGFADSGQDRSGSDGTETENPFDPNAVIQGEVVEPDQSTAPAESPDESEQGSRNGSWSSSGGDR